MDPTIAKRSIGQGKPGAGDDQRAVAIAGQTRDADLTGDHALKEVR